MTEAKELAALSLSTLAANHPLPTELTSRRAQPVPVRAFVLQATVFDGVANRIAAQALNGEKQ